VTFEQATRAELLDAVRALPKCELHLHLEGTIVPETLVALSARHDAEPLTLEQAHALYRYDNFQGFLLAFKAVTQRLLTPEDYELVTYEMVRRLARQGVVHAEVYVSVGVIYYWRKAEFEPLFAGMERGRLRGEREFGVTLYWIFDAVRHFGVDEGARVFRKAAEMRAAQIAAGQEPGKEPSIIGIGIGGDERRGPAEEFRDLYAEARDAGLRLTAHAGENAGPESIWAALNIGAERLGHCLTAQFDDELMAVLVERQVPVELCPSSNVATGCCRAMAEHPLRRYFESGLMVTLNSDDPPMFATDLLNEYAIAHEEFELSLEQLREISANSIEASFLPAERKLSCCESCSRR
jgi:aminodeoxyfutalosine deaminase